MKKVYGIFEYCFVSPGENGEHAESEPVLCQAFGVSEDMEKMDAKCETLNEKHKNIDQEQDMYVVLPISVI